MKPRSPDALELARRIAAGETIPGEAFAALDAQLARGLSRVAEIARECDSTSPEGARWGHLRDLRLAGRGSFGEVFRAYDPTLDRDVALKLKRVDHDALFASGRDFVAEARSLARVRHPHVIGVHGASFHDGRAGLWADWIDGETLQVRLQRERTLSTDSLWRLTRELGSALSAVHAAGLTHGDVKPANIMLDHQQRALLMDFGASFHGDAAALRAGTPRFLAPEAQRASGVGPAVDIYALGVVLCRAASGDYPDVADAVTRIRPRTLQVLVTRMLSADPEQRPTAANIVAAVERELAAPLRRARGLAAATALFALTAIALISFIAWRRADSLRIEAQQALAGTERANLFLTDLLAHSAPDQLGPSASLRELLDVAAPLAAQRFADDDHGRSLMLSALARIEAGLSNDEQASRLAAQAADAAEAAAPGAAETVFARSSANARAALAGAAETALPAQERLLEAVAARADSAQLLPTLWADLAEIEHRAWLRSTRPELRERERQHLEAALAAAPLLHGDTELQALRRLGSLRLEQGGYAEGVTLLRRARALCDATRGADHAECATTRRMLAWYLMHYEDHRAEAEALFRENLERHAAKLGPNARTLVDDEFGRAHALALLGRHAEALPLAERAWQAAQQRYGPVHRTTLDAGLTLADIYQGGGRLLPARDLLLALRERIAQGWSADTRHYVMTTQQLALVLQELGDARADALFADCAERAARLLGADNPLARGCRAHSLPP